MDDEEELGVWDDALVEQAVDVAVEEGVEDARDGGVGGEEGGEEDGGHDLCCSAVEVGVVAATAVPECLSNLMEVPNIVPITFWYEVSSDNTDLRFSVSMVFTSSLLKDSFTNRL